MSYKIELTPNFTRHAKRLSKKYKSLKDDLTKLFRQLENNPEMGESLGKDIYKVRMAIGSKGKGKSGGARIITYFKKDHNKILLLAIYNKGNQDSISKKELQSLIDKYV